MPQNSPQQQARALARDVLALAYSTLLAELRFLDAALCRLNWVESPNDPLATDGRSLYYSAVYVLRRWQADKAVLIRSCLHLVLHCLFQHPFVDGQIDRPAWDLACDIAAEACIDELGLTSAACERSPDAIETLAKLRKALDNRLTAERIYRYYCDRGLPPAVLEQLRTPFYRDEHTRWYEQTEQPGRDEKARDEQTDAAAGQADGEKQDGAGGEEQPGTGDDPRAGKPKTPGAPQTAEGPAKKRGQAKEQWKQLAARVQTDLETHSRRWGDRAGTLLQSLREAGRTRLDYGEFLRRFAVLSEVLQVDGDTFDTIFYTYGLRLYGDMPLVEPLEYSEARRIRDFVIVLDTSASVQGEKVRSFLQHTCQILLQADVYDARLELHVLECDARVQRDTGITGEETLRQYLEQLQFAGGGGTDFRPAFAYIEQLRGTGALPDLRGILYFTDGEGTYPQNPPGGPDCKTAFVFADAADTGAAVPPWAIKVLLDPDTLGRPQLLIFQ